MQIPTEKETTDIEVTETRNGKRKNDKNTDEEDVLSSDNSQDESIWETVEKKQIKTKVDTTNQRNTRSRGNAAKNKKPKKRN